MTETIRYIVPFAAGPTTVQARWLAARLTERLGQPVVVENHPGDGGAVGTALVARANPDGLTILAANPGPLTVRPNVRRVEVYDPLRDFAPIALIATVSSTIAVRRGLAAQSIGELVSYAQKHPGELAYGSPGIGTVGHLSLALFGHLSGACMRHVPLEGLADAVPALEGERIDVLAIPLPDARPLALEGRVRVLAVTRRTRSILWPEMPSVDESGIAGFETFNWNGIAAPARTPHEIVDRLNRAVNDVLSARAARDYLGGKGYEVEGGTPEAFGAFVKAESERWRRVAALAGIHA